MRREKVNEIDVYVEGEGTPLLCLHGWTMDHTMWRYQEPLTKRGIMLVTYDRRGHGDRQQVASGLDRDLSDIEALARHFSWRRFALLGMSQGARLAHTYAQRHPTEISHLILQSAPASQDIQAEPADQIPLEKYRDMIQSGQIAEFHATWMNHPLMACPFEPQHEHLREMVMRYQGADLISEPSRPHTHAAAKDAATKDATAKNAAYAGPLMTLTGAQEPQHIRAYADHLIDKHRAVSDTAAVRLDIQGQGHFTNMTAATRVNNAIIHFLTPQPARAVA